MAKGVIPNPSTGRPVSSSTAPNATVKEEEYDSSATVSSYFCLSMVLFNIIYLSFQMHNFMNNCCSFLDECR